MDTYSSKYIYIYYQYDFLFIVLEVLHKYFNTTLENLLTPSCSVHNNFEIEFETCKGRKSNFYDLFRLVDRKL